MGPNSKGNSLDQEVYHSLKEDLHQKQHVDAIISFYNDVTRKFEYTATCHRIALAAKSKLMHQLLASHHGPDEERVHVVLVDSIDAGKAEELVELMYDPDKTEKDIAQMWEIEEVKEEMEYMMEPETILNADEIKKEPVENDPGEREGGRVVCVAPGKYLGSSSSDSHLVIPASNTSRCEAATKKTPRARDILQRMSLSEKEDFRAVEDSMDRVYCLLCEKTLRISTSGVIKQHCNTATHKRKKEEAMAEMHLRGTAIKQEIPDGSDDPSAMGAAEDQTGNVYQNSQLSRPKLNAKKAKTLEEVLLDVNILENFALKAVANSKDKVFCQICEMTLICLRPIDIKAHCKTAEHIKKKEGKKITYSNQQLYDKMINELVPGAQNASGRRKTLQATLDEINIQENGVLSVVKGSKDKIFCSHCERTLTIGNIGEIKNHCKTKKHLQGKILPQSRASAKRSDPEYLFNDNLCDELCPTYAARPYKRKTFEETIEEINVQEDGAFSIVGDSRDEVHCSLCEKDFKVQQLASLKQHCRTSRHSSRREARKRENEEATGETYLRPEDIKTERPEVTSEEQQENSENNGESMEEDMTPSEGASVELEANISEALTEINTDEFGTFQVVENERDKIYCRICDSTFKVWQRSDIKRHSKRAYHLKNKAKEQDKRRKERWMEWKEGIKVLPQEEEGSVEDWRADTEEEGPSAKRQKYS